MKAALTDPEGAFVGALMWLPSAETRRLLANVETEDMTDPRHRAIVEAIRRCLADRIDEDAPVDPALVRAELRRSGGERTFTADREPGVYLLDLYGAVPVPASAGHYLRTVYEERERRAMTVAGQRLIQLGEGHDLTHARARASVEWAEMFRLSERSLCIGGCDE